MKVTTQELVNILRLSSQRFGNAAQGKLSEKTAFDIMMRINRLLARMEDDGFGGELTWKFQPEYGD